MDDLQLKFVEMGRNAETQLLVTHGLQLITRFPKKMHNRLLTLSDRLLLRKRAIFEINNDQLKHIWKTRSCPPS